MDISKDYDLFLDAITGLMVIDKNGNVVYMNEQCADYIKVDREKIMGKYVTEGICGAGTAGRRSIFPRPCGTGR